MKNENTENSLRGKLGSLVYLHSAEKVKFDSLGNVYTDGSYNESVWQRYLQIADTVTFIARKDDGVYSDEMLALNYNKIDDKVRVVLIEDRLSSLTSMFSVKKRKNNSNIIRHELQLSDLLMIRVDCNEGYRAARIAQKLDIPYATEVVGCAWDSLWYHSISGKVIAGLRYLQMRFVVKGAIASLYVTRQYLQRRYPANGPIAGCSDVTLYNTQDNQRIFKKKRLVKIGTIGPLDVSYKNQDAIIKVIRELNELNSDVRYEYHLVGAGSSDRLSSVAQKYGVQQYVKFVGQLKHDQIFEWLKTIDIYAQPSKVEGLPRALIEALHAGCPSIGSNLGGIPELLPERALFNWKSPESIINTIKYLSVPQNATNASSESVLVARQFNFDILKKTREDFYHKMILAASRSKSVK